MLTTRQRVDRGRALPDKRREERVRIHREMNRQRADHGATQAGSLRRANSRDAVLERDDVRGLYGASSRQAIERTEVGCGRRLRLERVVVCDDELERVVELRERERGVDISP